MKNFLFDLYGTLIDIRTDEQSDEFWNRIAALLNTDDGARVQRSYARLCAAERPPEGGEIDLLRVMEKLLKEFGADGEPLRFAKEFRAMSVEKLRLFDGVAELLEGLRARGGRLFLLSNAQACFTRFELDALGLSDKFDGVLLSSEVGWKKPSEKFFSAAFERFSLSPKECVYIGNDLHDDVAGASRAGMRSVYLPTEQSGKYAEEIPTDLSVKDHGELKSLLYKICSAFSQAVEFE